MSIARGSFDSYFQAAQDAYEEARRKSPPSASGFNTATENWQKAAAVQIPSPTLTPEAELESVRGVAKEWLAAALALFGLFSFTALFFGADTFKVFEDQSWLPAIVFGILALAAVMGAVACSFFGTRAAHGWPPKGLELKDVNGKARDRTAQEKMRHAREDLQRAMFAAAGVVAAIVVALATVLITQLAAAAPLQVEVLGKGEERIVCGAYKSADPAGITVNKDKVPVTTEWSKVGKVNGVRSC